MELWAQLVTQLGVNGVLVIAWWIEHQRGNREREYNKTLSEEREAENKILLERVLKGLHDAEAAIKGGSEAHIATANILTSLRDMLIVKGS